MELPQGPEPDASGYKGFFYHFLDIETGRRVWQCELTTIDSAFPFAGALTVATYFDRDTAEEVQVRQFANELYERADWNWACNGEPTLRMAGRRKADSSLTAGAAKGLAALLPRLGFADPPAGARELRCIHGDLRKNIYGRELLSSGPLFTHQLSHLWVDFQGIRDDFMRRRDSDYFENSRRATFVQQEYAIRNPMNFVGYGQYCWGFTACDGPGWITREVNGIERQFFDYLARGAPFGPDDGTIAPWVVIASLPFAPEIVVPTIRNFARMNLGMTRLYGFNQSFNQSFAVKDNPPDGGCLRITSVSTRDRSC